MHFQFGDHAHRLFLFMGFMGIITLIEVAIAKAKKLKLHDSNQSLINFWILFINANISFILVSFILKNAYSLIYVNGSHLVTSLRSPVYWLLLFLLQDFVYYWQHRYLHECRWGWASHVVHHSATFFNFTVEFRENVISIIAFGWILSLPLCWLGFHPAHIIAMQALLLFYQTWVHTELIGQLGWFDRIFNSPANHRVHHGSNPEYLDKNYGGALIIWDRLFGTYQPEIAKPVYGVVKEIHSNNLFVLYFHEYASIVRDVIRERSLKPIIFMPKSEELNKDPQS